MQSTWISSENAAKVSQDGYAASGAGRSHASAGLRHWRGGEEKNAHERRPSVGMTLLTISKLCGMIGMSLPDAGVLPPALRREISEAAQTSGSLVVPDIARECAVSTPDVIMVVPVRRDDALTPLYAKKHLLVELGMAIARSDGCVDDCEVVQLSYVMERHFSFTDLEIRALTALKDFCILYPPDLGATARLLASQMPAPERLEAAKMITTVAAAGGQIARGEFESLRQFFNMMELGGDALDKAIGELRQKRVWVLWKSR